MWPEGFKDLSKVASSYPKHIRPTISLYLSKQQKDNTIRLVKLLTERQEIS